MFSTTIYVGNIQSIKDEQLREYFERFGQIEAFYHNCTRAADEWLIDYRFIRFTSNTNINELLSNKIDHTISRICLDIHPYDVVFREETRLVSDRKICIAHTNPKLDRNIVKKAFTRYGRVMNCTCVSSGNGVEYVYIEFDTVNAVQAVCAKNQRHFAGRTSLAVRKAIRPSEIEVKNEPMSINEKPIAKYSSSMSQHVDTAQYSSALSRRESNSRTSTPFSNQSSNP